MVRERRFFQLPGNWEALSDEEIEQLSRRADRVQEILPDLPPLECRVPAGYSRCGPEDLLDDCPDGAARRRPGTDRVTELDQSTEQG